MSEDNWQAEDFGRRSYYVAGPDLDKARRIEVIVRVDGQNVIQVQAREPGLVAVISRPDKQGIDIEMVEPGGQRYTDIRVPKEGGETPLWALAALGITL